MSSSCPASTSELRSKILGYRANGKAIREIKPGMLATACVVTCSQCSRAIRGMGGPISDAQCPTCWKAPRKILAHRNGLLCGCKVLEVDGTRVRVHVTDERRPKWIDLAEGKQKLFDNTDEAILWVEEQHE